MWNRKKSRAWCSLRKGRASMTRSARKELITQIVWPWSKLVRLSHPWISQSLDTGHLWKVARDMASCLVASIWQGSTQPPQLVRNRVFPSVEEGVQLTLPLPHPHLVPQIYLLLIVYSLTQAQFFHNCERNSGNLQEEVIRRNCSLTAAANSKLKPTHIFSIFSHIYIPYSGFPPRVGSSSADMEGWPVSVVSGPTSVAALVCPTNSFHVIFSGNYDRGRLCLDKDNL